MKLVLDTTIEQLESSRSWRRLLDKIGAIEVESSLPDSETKIPTKAMKNFLKYLNEIDNEITEDTVEEIPLPKFQVGDYAVFEWDVTSYIKIYAIDILEDWSMLYNEMEEDKLRKPTEEEQWIYFR